ncbi:hypothetical protein BDY19DRAFT_991864 [Irpex rosettiformis]|uniref:Uncharacterized protein n=1 Tax=Irpex rosettiformis TaxID=378272 RepID=A0ACB8UAM1_9APHY|nr:hypothetical protein BDY19DRAFT_991864 [Irpex rosettiformis]
MAISCSIFRDLLWRKVRVWASVHISALSVFAGPQFGTRESSNTLSPKPPPPSRLASYVYFPRWCVREGAVILLLLFITPPKIQNSFHSAFNLDFGEIVNNIGDCLSIVLRKDKALSYPKASSPRAMQVDDTADQHDDLDTDSLFGSPPPSPGRGRSPSPLALPSGQNNTQNVGTLALPGSHLCSEFYELPSAPSPPPSVPVKRSATNQLQPQLPSSISASGTSRSGTPGPRGTISSRKPKRASRRSTPDIRPTPPPITLPSPTEPLPANFLRNQQALLGLAGLVSGVNPANLSVPRHTRGESPSNPIVVEDVPDTPTIGRQPVYLPGPLPVPSTQEVLSALVRQKNLYSVVNALVRLVNNAAGTPVVPVPYPPAAPPSTPIAGSSQASGYYPAYYPYSPYQYSYQYAYPYSYPYPASYPHSSYQQYAIPFQPPPLKKRKLTNVPAGAADWDVPYPFPAGQGPRDYHSTWAQHRQQQLLEDLVGLVKSASKKAAAKKAKDEVESEAAIGSVEYYKERFLRHCRPPSSTTAPAPAQPERKEDTQVEPLCPTLPQRITEASTAVDKLGIPTLDSTPASGPENEVDSTAQPQDSISEATQEDTAFAEDFTPKTPTTPHVDLSTAAFPSISPEAPDAETPTTSSSDLDELLALLNDLPAADLDVIFAPSEPGSEKQAANSPDVSDLQPAETPSELPAIDPSLFAIDPSLLAIDPTLLAISFPQMYACSSNQVGHSGHSFLPAMPSGASTASETPPLAGSPMSLAELDPPTPNWDFNFPEPEIAVASADGESTNGTSGGRTGGIVFGHEDEGVQVQRRDKGKGKAREKDFMGVQQDCSVSQSVAEEGVVTPRHLEGKESVTPVPVTISEGPTPRSTVAVSSTNQTLQCSLLPTVLPHESPFRPSPVTRPFLARSSVGNKSLTSSIQGKNKEDIVRRARLMRAQIVEEIERAKVELWETTMEGGCLAVLAKEREKLA